MRNAAGVMAAAYVAMVTAGRPAELPNDRHPQELLSTPITISGPARPVQGLLQDIQSQAPRWTFKIDPKTAQRTVYVSVQKMPLKELLRHLCDVTGSQLIDDGKNYKLEEATQKLRLVEKRKRLEIIESSIQKMPPVSRQSSFADKVLQNLISAMGAENFADFPENRRVVFSNDPNAEQIGFPSGLLSNPKIGLDSFWSTVSNPGKLILVYEFDGRMQRPSFQLKVGDAQGKAIADTGQLILLGPEPQKVPENLGDFPITWDDKNADPWGKIVNEIGSGMPLSPASLNLLQSPEKDDPTNLIVPYVKALSEGRTSGIVACFPDEMIFAAARLRKKGLTSSQLVRMITGVGQSSIAITPEGVLTIKPQVLTRPSFNRAALERYFTAAAKNPEMKWQDLAAHIVPQPWGFMTGPARVITRWAGYDELLELNWRSESALRLFGALPPGAQKELLDKPAGIAVSGKPSDVVKEIFRQHFTGTSGITIIGKPELLLQKEPSEWIGLVDPLQITVFKDSDNTVLIREDKKSFALTELAIGVVDNGEQLDQWRFALGKKDRMLFRIKLADDMFFDVPSQLTNKDVNVSQSFVPYSQLPERMREELDRRIAGYRDLKQSLKGAAHPPPMTPCLP